MMRQNQIARQVFILRVDFNNFLTGYGFQNHGAGDSPVPHPHVDMMGPKQLAFMDTSLNKGQGVPRVFRAFFRHTPRPFRFLRISGSSRALTSPLSRYGAAKWWKNLFI